MPATIDGPIFRGFKRVLREDQQRPLNEETERCSQSIVDQLIAGRTTNERPGMLLGRIQSGKTRAFVGAIAIALDSDFEIAIVLTKGTVALTKQTVARLRSDLGDSVAQPRSVIVEDIRHLPNPLEPYEQNRKLIFVCKKETRNLQKLGDVMLRLYPHFSRRRVLVIDDEADSASVGYRQRNGVLDLRVIPGHIDDLRAGLQNASYLQVTATPQALYLQPVELDVPGRQHARQVRPMFTFTVPTHAGYVGGRQYFDVSREAGTTESYLHVPLPDSELEALREEDEAIFRLENVLLAPSVAALRRAVVTFVVGGILRQLRQEDGGEPPKPYSFILHTATRTSSHRWQDRVARELIARLRTAAAADFQAVQGLVDAAHADLTASLAAEREQVPTLARVRQRIGQALDSMMVTTVNGTKDIEALLDENGQLRLRTPYNFFIGGQILDRGLTIDNLIGFYYGRSPLRAQEDTTLQHCRMYGNRPRPDLAVTRFYTTPNIYQRMLGIYEREEALWEAIARGEMDPDRVFLRADPTGQTQPCGLQKIAASRVTTLTAGRELLPVGFSTHASRYVQDAVARLDEVITPARQNGAPFEISVETAIQITDLTNRMIRMDPGEVFDWKAMKAAIRLLARQNPEAEHRDRVVCLVRTGVNYDKFRFDRGVRRLQNEPHGYRDPERVRQTAGFSPGLVLLRQVGSIADHWSGDPFYWPVLIVPNNVPPRLFSEENA